jgi:protein ImuA
MAYLSKSYRVAEADGSPPGGSLLSALRQAIRGIEARHVADDAAAAAHPLGLAELDAALGGGLPRALHEIAAASETEIPAASLFALMLIGKAAPAGAILWIAEDMAGVESGAPYGPGLDAIGIGPERIVTVAAPRARDVLWAMEEALRSRAPAAVVGEIRHEGVEAVAVRRLSLAAHRQTLALLLRARPDTRPLAAATRWVIGAARSAAGSPSQESGRKELHATGPPVLAVRLVRNRYGPVGSWLLEWKRAGECFDLASAHPQPVAEAAADRPGEAIVA